MADTTTSEKYLNLDGLELYDAKIKEVIQKDITVAWTASQTYSKGVYVVHNGLLYQCNTTHTASAEWDSSHTAEGTNWDQVKLIDDVIPALAIGSLSVTSPLSVTTSGNTATIELEDYYGDTKTPYGPKNPNRVLAGPSTGTTSSAPTWRNIVPADFGKVNGHAVLIGPNTSTSTSSEPTFRVLDAADIPDLSATYLKTLSSFSGNYGSSSKIPTFTISANGQITAISEADVVSAKDSTITIKKNGTTVSSFTLNQSTSSDIDIDDVASATSLSTAEGNITAIQNVIPSAATTSNLLADQAWVTEQVRTNAAHFRGNFDNWAGVPTSDSSTATPHYIQAPDDPTGKATPTLNDYMIVNDASDYGSGSQYIGAWRFIYTGSWGTSGKNGWEPAYAIDRPITLKTINTTATASLTTSSGESLEGSGTLDLHKISKTGTYSDLVNKPTFGSTNGISSGTDTYGLKIAQGTNVTITRTAGTSYSAPSTITISATDTGATALAGNTAETNKAIVSATYTSSDRTITFSKAEFVTPTTLSTTVSNMVTTTSTLSSDYLVLGNGNKTVKASTVSVSELALTADLPVVSVTTSSYSSPVATIKGISIDGDEYNFYVPDSIAAATTSVLGSVKLGTASAGTATKTYPVGFNDSQQMYVDVPWTDTATAATGQILDGTNSGTQVKYAPYTASTASATWVGNNNNAGKLYLGDENPSKTTRLNYNGYLYATKLYSGGKEVITSIPVTDVKVGTSGDESSIVSSTIATLTTNSIYHSTSNPIATMSDVPSVALSSQTISANTTNEHLHTTWGLNGSTVVFDSITEAEITNLFTA